MKKFTIFCIYLLAIIQFITISVDAIPVRLAIVGLVHGHVGGFFNGALNNENIELVGVYDPREDLFEHYQKQFSLNQSLYYSDLKDLLEKAKPQAVAVNTSTYDHLRIIEICAQYGVHVMVEKPLAVSLDHGAKIASAAKQGNIHVLVNYETTWYPSHHTLYKMIQDQKIGEIRKVVVRDGHRGPQEIGCSSEFLDWLTDPVLNGAGALYDFGCYGANLATWLMNNQRPISVSCITQQIKPDIYPKVDDEATILLTYPKAQAIIQASWNWPYNRKDMDVYGKTGYINAVNNTDMRYMIEEGKHEAREGEKLEAPYDSSLNYLAAVVRGEIKAEGLSSLENNLIVTEILNAARQAALTGKTVYLQ